MIKYINEMIDCANNAIDKYGQEHIELLIEENNNCCLIYHSKNNSFAIKKIDKYPLDNKEYRKLLIDLFVEHDINVTEYI